MIAEQLIAASPTSLLIAPIVGGYLCISGVGLLKAGEADAFLTDLCRHPAAMHGVGAIAFFVGAAILSFHRHWGAPAEIVINIVALLWVIEGAGLLADSARLRTLLAMPTAAARLRSVQVINIALGVYLIVVSLLGSSG